MNCLAEDHLVEILDRGGLTATRAEERTHLESCAACREAWATVAAAGDVLAQHRPRPAAARAWIPVSIAAAMLLAIVGVILSTKTPSPVTPRDPVALFLEGTPREAAAARAALLRGGRTSILSLLASRPKWKGSARSQAVLDLLFDLRAAGVSQDREDQENLEKLRTVNFTIKCKDMLAADIVKLIGSSTSTNLLLDPRVDAGRIQLLDVEGTSLRAILETLCAVAELDFDLRYGVIFVSTPLRLWSIDPAVGLRAANAWRTQAPEAIAEKLLTMRCTFDMAKAPIGGVLESLREVSGLAIAVDEAVADAIVDFRVMDISLAHILELLTLPHGWDVRFEAGSLRIVK